MTASLNLFLIDEDPVFRLGLKIWLEQQPGYRVIGEASNTTDALTQLEKIQDTALEQAGDAAWADAAPRADVVVLDLGLGQGDPAQLPGLQLCCDLKRRFPTLPVLVLSAQGDEVLQAAARAMGADGFGLRSLPVRELAALIRQVVYPEEISRGGVPKSRLLALSKQPLARLRQSSLQQIAGAIADIETQQAQKPALWYGSVLAGRRRELRTARWLIQNLLPEASEPEATEAEDPVIDAAPIVSTAGPRETINREIVVANARTRVCEAVFRKLQYPLENSSGIPLEIDILRSDRARELLYTLLRAFEDLLDDVKTAQLPPGRLLDTVPDVLRDLWQKGVTDFFGRYYTPQDSGFEQPIATVLSQDEITVQQSTLSQIPEVGGLLAHLLFEEALIVDGTPYMATTPEALRRSQLILENLLLQTACAVMQPLLNRFADVESLKKGLYQRRMMSSRDIARFRNDLSWRYRWDHLVNEPKAIFESQRRFFALSPNGIQVQWVYAPRTAELENLGGAPYALTLALEARDAIAPRVRAVVSLVGSSLVYVLTEVVGRGSGLVGRGVLKGIGSAWQETRIRQRRRDEV